MTKPKIHDGLSYFKEFKIQESAVKSAQEAKSSRIAAWISAGAAIVAAIATVVTLFKS